ncbi:hypothetical protein SASPL_118233 [Salvia splendens]|uniref:Uncharacterized protein n=1 Tax=Salvia splendens TaxID=180675 RepID=A0A8X8ZYY2_SALSN|nr:hypothetical protein SASPL_118233 [Salvia splendens]
MRSPSPSAFSSSSPPSSSPPTSATAPSPPAADNSVYLPRIIFVGLEGENVSQNAVVCLDQAVINSHPKFVFTKKSGAAADDDALLPRDARGCVAEAQRVVPRLQEFAAPDGAMTALQQVVPLSLYSGEGTQKDGGTTVLLGGFVAHQHKLTEQKIGIPICHGEAKLLGVLHRKIEGLGEEVGRGMEKRLVDRSSWRAEQVNHR